MKRWVARAIGAPGTTSFARFERVVARAEARRPWAAALDDASVSAAAREAVSGMAAGAVASPRLLAVLRTAASRSVGQEPFDEQLLAVCALLSGYAVEMDTGEGKTLTGALAAAAFALAGRGVHVLSVNDYLAERDATWMRPLFEMLGMSVAWIGQRTGTGARRRAYRCDVVYAPVSEVGYDVLRDRFVTAEGDRVEPGLDVALVDEADAVMIDEAMSPLVLAGASPEPPEEFSLADALVRDLDPAAHYAIDADHATVSLTDAGLDRLEQRLGGINLYDTEHTATLTKINLALHAHVLVRRDVDYLVVDDAITLINSSRGRLAHQQRWPDGLHAAVEAKEGLSISSPGLVLDTLTVQDLLRSYTTLTGMSGTVVAVADELIEFFELRSGRVQRRRPNRRVDQGQRVFVDDRAREAAVVAEVVERHRTGQPVLVGTQSVRESERFAVMLAAAGVDVQVLNARNDAGEAAVIARAGTFGAVTISTQMSGRGTDIRLGGPDEADHERVAATGGLAVLQVGRYPSARLDAQLRGRSGRQGDPGVTQAYVSTDDELVQTHAPRHHLEKIRRRGARLDQTTLRVIVDHAQRAAESARRTRHRDTWDFSRAIARQRRTVLADRAEVLAGDRAGVELARRIPSELAQLVAATSSEVVDRLGRDVTLWTLDEHWCDHLARLTEVRDGIHLQALAGMNPRDEFHRIALREFHGFFTAAYDRAAEIVRTVSIDQAEQGLAGLGLRRPSATWTYMTSDNPLGTPIDRAARNAGTWVRSRVYRIE